MLSLARSIFTRWSSLSQDAFFLAFIVGGFQVQGLNFLGVLSVNGSNFSKIAFIAFAALGFMTVTSGHARASILYSEVVDPDQSALNADVQKAILALESGDDDLGQSTATILHDMAPEQFRLTFYNITDDILGNAAQLELHPVLTDTPTAQPEPGLTIAPIQGQTFLVDEAGLPFTYIPTGSEDGSANPVSPQVFSVSAVPLPGSVGMFVSALLALLGLSRLRPRGSVA